MAKERRILDDEWTGRDEALWATAELGVLLKRGQLHLRVPQAVPFALRLGGTAEKIFAHGPFQLLAWTAPGDGTYVHNTSTMFAVGRGAIPTMLGFAAVRAIGNSSRRAKASAMSQPRWTQIDQGTLSIGNYGFYLHTPSAIFAWNWASIHLASLIGPGSLSLQGQSETGPVNWVLNSDWAELLFLLWASVCNPDHPQMTGRTWLPEEWMTKAMIHFMETSPYPNRAYFNEVMRGLR